MLIVIPDIPPASLRGNSRAGHWGQRNADRKAWRELGWAIGKEKLSEYDPLSTPVAVSLRVWMRRRIDLDNLLIGYKPLWDGLEDSGLLANDRLIESMTIEYAGGGGPKTEIYVYLYTGRV